MKRILVRLFIVLPLITLWFMLIFTVVVPMLFWVITGGNYLGLYDEILYLED